MNTGVTMCNLKAFKKNGRTCSWPGCNNEAVDTTLKIKGKTIHCIKHTLYKLSGRVSQGHYNRDYYREHLNFVCVLTGLTWKDAAKFVKKVYKSLNYKPSKIEFIREASRMFQCDHIDGDHYNNEPSNLQTLAVFDAHKIKSMVYKDYG